DFDVDALAAILKGRRTQIKGVLRDQHIIAGIGNAYSDEVLHAAKMSPYKLASSFTPEEVAALHAAIVTTLRDTVDRSAGRAAARGGGGQSSRARRRPACACTARPACPARSAGTRSARFPSLIPRSSTAPRARPAASRWPTDGFPGCSSSKRLTTIPG